MVGKVIKIKKGWFMYQIGVFTKYTKKTGKPAIATGFGCTPQKAMIKAMHDASIIEKCCV